MADGDRGRPWVSKPLPMNYNLVTVYFVVYRRLLIYRTGLSIYLFTQSKNVPRYGYFKFEKKVHAKQSGDIVGIVRSHKFLVVGNNYRYMSRLSSANLRHALRHQQSTVL